MATETETEILTELEKPTEMGTEVLMRMKGPLHSDYRWEPQRERQTA